jgi:hypothetical protein
MLLKINEVEIAEYPSEFSVTTMDLDNGDSTTRSANGTLNRDRIAVKRQITMGWGLIEWSKLAKILQAMANMYFQLYYPDPMDGVYATKTFYVGDRPCPVAVEQNGKMYWLGVKVTLTER